jgi:glutamyl-tRNA(Gln) amidotransferase subunit D
MPSTSDRIVIKSDSGYNIGFRKDGVSLSLIKKGRKKEIKRKGSHERKKQIDSQEVNLSVPSERDLILPTISILSTGGTIASKVDYRTGAVTSQFTAEEIIDAIPALGKIANCDATIVYNILSENMLPQYWIELARKIYAEIDRRRDGIIVTHGTDTMGYTAAALSFMLETPVPVVLVGSQRSSDRPSSDSTMNAVCAAKVATSDLAEIVVVMHGSTSDDFCYIHRGTKVRKMHTSARDAFVSINTQPIGRVYYEDLRMDLCSDYKKRDNNELKLHDHLEDKCCLIKFYPGSNPDVIDFYLERGYKGIVIEGTGLGHVSTEWLPNIKRAIEDGITVVMASQCLYGRTCDRVYDTGRDLLRVGVIEGGRMLPETALVKLMWVLGRTDDMGEVRRIMQHDVAGELI